MLIQWFPGHMNKSLREMKDDLKLIDTIIYVLDARAPISSINYEFQNIIDNRPVIYILNKADLISRDDLSKYINYFKNLKFECIPLNSTVSFSTKILVNTINRLFKEKIDKSHEKGINLVIRSMVIGVPNCGKSTIINNMCGQKKALTGDKPGITKGRQWVKIANHIELLDTPGILVPNFEDEKTAQNLAYIGSIKDDVIDIETLSLHFIDDLKNIYFDKLVNRYSLKADKNDENLKILKEICHNRGLLISGGEYDLLRGAKLLLDDFRKGRLGQIALDEVK